ncbi:hypothetical protein DFH27DRAFT_605350 [Peziza echinospora]|nr:hypothetical protein DFH27DRAFT_605350 [Peziza echinospora]
MACTLTLFGSALPHQRSRHVLQSPSRINHPSNSYARMEKSSKQSDQRKPRTVYALDNPFCQVQWPTIDSKEDQDLVLELLCALLSPIGDHRRLHRDHTASKGKRSKRYQRETRKRIRLENAGPENDSKMSLDEDESSNDKIANGATPAEQGPLPAPSPPPPELSSHATIGLNSITQHLNTLAAINLPPTLPLQKQHSTKSKQKENSKSNMNHTIPFTAIFLTRADSQPTPLHAHLPVLTYIASASSPNPTLLIPLPRGASARLQSALALPSVNFIGLLSTLPETGIAGELLQLVRRIVKPITVPWLEGKLPSTASPQTTYLPLKVKKLRTTVGPPKQKAPQVETPAK